MDLAEIRKKARLDKERERNQQPVALLPGKNAGDESPTVGLPADQEDEFFFTEVAPVPQVTQLPGAVRFDPLAILLAGREDALAHVDEVDEDEEADLLEATEHIQLLCFRVASEEYAINIMDIKEITRPRETTEVPHAPPFVLGVLSLRGLITPVFHLRTRLGLPSGEPTSAERIVVVRRGEELFGLLVDEVTQVVKINKSTLEQPPAVLDGIDRDFVCGIGRFGGRMLILLQLDKVLDVSLVQM